MAQKVKSPFVVKLDPKAEQELADRLATDIEDALAARINIVGDDAAIDAWHTTYEGGDGRIYKDRPWPGAANLTSFIGTEKVAMGNGNTKQKAEQDAAREALKAKGWNS